MIETLPADRALKQSILRGILWKEWREHSVMIVRWLLLAFIGLLLLQVLYHPVFVGILAVIYAWALTRRIAGGDVWEGTEEFAFALPPTRRMLFWLRYALCAVPFLTVLVGGLLCVRFNVPQALWGLFVDSGFTEPFPIVKLYWYPLALLLAISVYHVCFAINSMVFRRSALLWSWLAGGGTVGALALGGLAIDTGGFRYYGEYVPLFTCGLPVLGAIITFITACVLYPRKEGIARPAQPAWRSGILLVVIIVIVIAVLLVLSIVLVRESAVENVREGHIEKMYRKRMNEIPKGVDESQKGSDSGSPVPEESGEGE